MKILNFGSCNIDYVYSLDHIVSVGETETTDGLAIFPGGKGLNQSIALARAGAQVYHAGCLGSDGEMLRDVLRESGVDLSYIETVETKNGHAVIQVSAKGENSIFLYPGSNQKVSVALIDRVLENFGEGDILLLQNEISHVDYIIERAHGRGMCIVLNPSPFNRAIEALDLHMLSYVILNEVEAGEISGCATPEESLVFFRERYPSLRVMLTLGGRGCIYMDAEQELYQPAFSVEAVDTTAAGDTFTGYFIAELSRGTAYAEILKIAAAASAIAVTRNGAAPSIPKRDEVLARLKELRPRKTRGQMI